MRKPFPLLKKNAELCLRVQWKYDCKSFSFSVNIPIQRDPRLFGVILNQLNILERNLLTENAFSTSRIYVFYYHDKTL